MSAVTAYAVTGIRVRGLPLRQETVKVIVPRSPGGDLLMALETVVIVYGYGLFRRLDGGMGIQRQSVVGAEQLGLHAPSQSSAGVTVNAASIFCFME